MFLVCLFLSGCKEKNISRISNTKQNNAQKSECINDRARSCNKEIDVDNGELVLVNTDSVWAADIPVPLQAIEKKNYYEATPASYCVGYVAPLDRDILVDFYKEQMELFGWQCWWQTDGLESLLLFEKPYKQCVVSIRPSAKNKQEIIVLQKTV